MSKEWIPGWEGIFLCESLKQYKRGVRQETKLTHLLPLNIHLSINHLEYQHPVTPTFNLLVTCQRFMSDIQYSPPVPRLLQPTILEKMPKRGGVEGRQFPNFGEESIISYQERDRTESSRLSRATLKPPANVSQILRLICCKWTRRCWTPHLNLLDDWVKEHSFSTAMAL